jgi:3-hydroxyacyl-[acyl-carrier-protein] dehydratase
MVDVTQRSADASHDRQVIRRAITVSPKLDYFAGHFPDEPILPGVALLHAFVLPACRQQWPELGRLARLCRVKFVRPIRHGDGLELVLEREASGPRVDFTLDRNGETVSSGRLFFAPPAEESQ